jgi:uncharacterized protein
LDRVFLDSNVLFSAAYRRDAGLKRLWQLADVELLTSAYALEEARRNLPERGQRVRLARLKRAVTLVREPAERALPRGIVLPDKDRPVLLAALDGRATHFVTGAFRALLRPQDPKCPDSHARRVLGPRWRLESVHWDRRRAASRRSLPARRVSTDEKTLASLGGSGRFFERRGCLVLADHAALASCTPL